MYFSSEQVAISFKRLSSRKPEGKTHMERTSALMYFLAFDAVSKSQGQPVVNFDPDKMDGKNNRKFIELEFTKLVLLSNELNKITQVSELGKIDRASKHPEKRISSNFLTVPLKKGSDHSTPYYYPKRPATPLMKLGQAATGQKWGIEHSDEWKLNLPIFLSDVKYSSPFTDLAIFIFRDTSFGDDSIDYSDMLTAAMGMRFTNELSEFWHERIEKERLFAKHVKLPSSKEHEPFGKNNFAEDEQADDSVSNNRLADHITYLENLLVTNNIEFNTLQ
jgi:hypothetical protein